MLAFLDESGDPGLKADRGSSRYFIVALVLFAEDGHAEAADRRIDALRAGLGLHPRYEFRFNKLSRELRLAFLMALNQCRFTYHGVVINKPKLYGPRFRFKDSFYKYVSQMVFNNARDYLVRATVVIDGSGSREFRTSLDRYLRSRVNDEREVIRKVKIQDSHRNNLLQLADMVAGSLARSYGGKQDADVYRAVIRSHEAGVQFWPK